jgi:starvation-inducible DNA-binding protein
MDGVGPTYRAHRPASHEDWGEECLRSWETVAWSMTDTIAERARKIAATTIRSISDIAKNQRLKDNNKQSVSPMDMISELCNDNQQLTRSLRAAHEVRDRQVWIDESERRTWFLAEIARDA